MVITLPSRDALEKIAVSLLGPEQLLRAFSLSCGVGKESMSPRRGCYNAAIPMPVA
jgi:hypothetical protein